MKSRKKISTNFRKQDFYTNGTLFLHPDKIIDPAIRSNYFMIFRNVRDFGVNLSNCMVEYRVKNSPDEFGISCYETIMDSWDKEGQRMSVNFYRPGCMSATKNGDDITQSGVHLPYILANWHVVRIVMKNKQVRTYLDGKLLSDNLHQNDFKQLCSLDIRSKGSCMVDYVRVYDGAGKLAHSDDFDKVPVSTIGGY